MTQAEFNGLYGEVVTYDCYRINDVPSIVSVNDPSFVHWQGHQRTFTFKPRKIYDLGANIGTFTKYAHELYPDAEIIAVEPEPNSFNELSMACGKFAELHRIAIGKTGANVYRPGGEVNSTGICYISPNRGYNQKYFDWVGKADIEAISLKDLCPDDDYHDCILKIDIEGNETCIFEDSMDTLKKFGYIAFELHNHALDFDSLQSVKDLTESSLKELYKTHTVIRDHVYAFATKL